MSAHPYELLRRRAEEYPDAVAIGGQQGLMSIQAFTTRPQQVSRGLTREAERAISNGTGAAETPGDAARVAGAPT